MERGLHLGRQSRRILGNTGAVARNMPTLRAAADEAAVKLWVSMLGRQIVLWLDNWYRRRFSCDPQRNDMSLNVSAMAVLHITSIPLFPGYPCLGDVLDNVSNVAGRIAAASARLIGGVDMIVGEGLRPEWIRVPLDVHREGMRSLQWLPYILTEESVSSQLDLLSILESIRSLHNQTRRVVPLLVDMDIHYRILKLIYGSGNVDRDFTRSMSQTPVLYGVWFGGSCFFRIYCNAT